VVHDQTQALEGIDASFLYLESAGVAMQTVKIAVFEPGSAVGFRWGGLREAVAIAAQQLPALRRCLVVVPAWLHHPRWIDAAQLDVDAHLEHIELEPGAGDEALERLVAEAAARWLPRHRPLWRLSVVTGLHEHRLAAIVTLHHSIADGGAALGLLEVLTQAAPGEWTAPTFYGDRLVTYRPSWIHLLWYGLVARIRSLVDLPKLIWQSMRGWLRARGLRKGRLAKLFAGPRTFFNRTLGRTREFVHLELPLAELRAIKDGLCVTVNDVLLALVSGAAARLRAAGELDGPSLICAMPIGAISQERAGDERPRLEGNRVANALVDLHDDLSDPLERVQAIAASTRAAKLNHDLRGPRRLMAWAEFDAWVWQRLIWAVVRRLRRPPINLIVSNVHGPDEPRYCGHLRLDQFWSVGPLIHRVGLNLTAWSYAGAVDVSILADGGQWTRARLMGLRAGLEDECTVLRALAAFGGGVRGASQAVPLP